LAQGRRLAELIHEESEEEGPAVDPLELITAGGSLVTIGTIIIRHTAGIGDDTYRHMLTIGLMFVAVGLVGSFVAPQRRRAGAPQRLRSHPTSAPSPPRNQLTDLDSVGCR
jgi:hypothetical protein